MQQTTPQGLVVLIDRRIARVATGAGVARAAPADGCGSARVAPFARTAARASAARHRWCSCMRDRLCIGGHLGHPPNHRSRYLPLHRGLPLRRAHPRFRRSRRRHRSPRRRARPKHFRPFPISPAAPPPVPVPCPPEALPPMPPSLFPDTEPHAFVRPIARPTTASNESRRMVRALLSNLRTTGTAAERGQGSPFTPTSCRDKSISHGPISIENLMPGPIFGWRGLRHLASHRRSRLPGQIAARESGHRGATTPYILAAVAGVRASGRTR